MKNFLRKAGVTLRVLTGCLFDPRVTRSSAGASYYILFMIFPFLISLSLLTTKLDYSEVMIEKFQQYVPAQIQDGIIAYFHYAESHLTTSFIVIGLVFSLYFCFNAVNFVTATLEDIFTPERRHPFFRRLFRVAGVALVMVISTPILFLTIVLGRNIMMSLQNIFQFPMWIISVWSYLRFPLAGLIMLVLISLAYRFAAHESDMTSHELNICATLCFVIWLGITFGFTFYLERIGDYSLLYGALGTVIALLLWLYFTAYSFFFSALLVVAYKKFNIKNREVSK
ncbi:MAG: YihY/virulence factor BrkB family protein [Clostridia bacterium]|nr:YihY/virulence factor BrkB family protein [Clostridia bacterium]